MKSTPHQGHIILLSVAILFSEATPGKIFQMLDHMQVSCISNRTFYYLKSQCPQSVVVSAWGAKQQNLLTQCRSQGTLLSVGGDGQADNPGKHGSRGIIELDSHLPK